MIFYVLLGNTGWNGYRNKSQHRKLTLEKKILPPAPAGIQTRGPFNHEYGALTNELSCSRSDNDHGEHIIVYLMGSDDGPW